MSHPSTRWFGRILLKHNKTEAGNFPSQIISKSDETTIQNCKTIIERFAKSEGYTSCKMEGQSGTYLFEMKGKKPSFFYVCSRNVVQDTPDKKCYYEDLGNVYINNITECNISEEEKWKNSCWNINKDECK